MWVILATATVALFTWVFSPRRLTAKEIYVTWLVIIGINYVVDVFGAHVFHLYYFMGDKLMSWPSLVMKLYTAPLAAMVFLTYLPSGLLHRWYYVIGWTVVSTGIEYAAVNAGYLTYTGWNLAYSAVFYFAALWYMVWHISFLRRGRL